MVVTARCPLEGDSVEKPIVRSKAKETTERGERSKSSLTRRLGLSMGATLAALAFAELLLRLLGIVPPRWVRPSFLERADKRAALDAYPDNPRGTFDVDLRDPEVRRRWRSKGIPLIDEAARRTPFAVALEYNAQLCRGGDVGPRDPGVQRIVVIGDSFAEGQGVTWSNTFSSLLAAELDGPVEVINCGRRGHDFPEIRRFFERQLTLDPDVVIYAMVLNDPVRSDTFHRRQSYLDDWIMDRRRMVTDAPVGAPPFWELRLYSLAHDVIEGHIVGRETTMWYRDMYGEANREGWAATGEHVELMHRTMQRRGGELVVALLPLLVSLDGDYPFVDISRTIAGDFRARGIAFHDTTAAFLGREPSELWVHPADRHPNEAGHRIIADELRPVLQRILERRQRAP